jgi:hypothetical protein
MTNITMICKTIVWQNIIVTLILYHHSEEQQLLVMVENYFVHYF